MLPFLLINQSKTPICQEDHNRGGFLTEVISLGWAPCFSSSVTMSVWPC